MGAQFKSFAKVYGKRDEVHPGMSYWCNGVIETSKYGAPGVPVWVGRSCSDSVLFGCVNYIHEMRVRVGSCCHVISRILSFNCKQCGLAVNERCVTAQMGCYFCPVRLKSRVIVVTQSCLGI